MTTPTDNTSKVTGEYLLLERPDLRAWHYAHGDGEEPHQGFHDGSMAWTHCTCFGAAHRAVEPLLADIERLMAENERLRSREADRRKRVDFLTGKRTHDE